MKTYSKCLFLGTVLFLGTFTYSPSFAMQSDDSAQKALNSQTFNIKRQGIRLAKFTGQVALAAGIGYGMMVLQTLFHELGHALVARCLNGDPISIYIGEAPMLWWFAPLEPGIHFNGSWLKFMVEGGSVRSSMTPGKEALTALAGPAFGILTAIMCDKILKNQKWLPTLTTQLCRDVNILSGISDIYQLIPAQARKDGGIIAQKLNIIDFKRDGEVKSPLLRKWMLGSQDVCHYGRLFGTAAKALYDCYKYYPQ